MSHSQAEEIAAALEEFLAARIVPHPQIARLAQSRQQLIEALFHPARWLSALTSSSPNTDQ